MSTLYPSLLKKAHLACMSGLLTAGSGTRWCSASISALLSKWGTPLVWSVPATELNTRCGMRDACQRRGGDDRPCLGDFGFEAGLEGEIV